MQSESSILSSISEKGKSTLTIQDITPLSNAVVIASVVSLEVLSTVKCHAPIELVKVCLHAGGMGVNAVLDGCVAILGDRVGRISSIVSNALG